MSSLAQIIISHNDDGSSSIMAGIMSVAILSSLFLVFFFVTLLHCYARLFLAQGGGGGSERRGAPPVFVVGARRLFILQHRLLHVNSSVDREMMMMSDDQSLATKGLEPRVLSSIPVFSYDGEGGDRGLELECVICLSLFERGEKGRRLALCGHAFHVGCIDTWLQSHSTCPVCRVSQHPNDVVLGPISEDHETEVDETRLSSEASSQLEIVVEVPSSEGGSHGTRKEFLSSNQTE